jgi:tetratricopeptide (TPR) repeat protein
MERQESMPARTPTPPRKRRWRLIVVIGLVGLVLCATLGVGVWFGGRRVLATVCWSVGYRNYEQGRYDEAVEAYRTAIRLWPHDWAFHNELGDAYYALGSYDDAEKAHLDAYRLDPEIPAVLIHLGRTHSKLEMPWTALKDFREAVRLGPNLAVAHYELAGALEEVWRREDAVESYREAIRLDPKDADNHYQLGRLLKDLDRFEEAAAKYREAVRLDPNDGYSHWGLAASLHKMGHASPDRALIEEALVHYRRARQYLPKHVGVHYGIGVALYDLGRDPSNKGQLIEAERELREAVRLDPTAALPNYYLSRVLRALGLTTEADKAYEAAVEAKMEHFNLGQALLHDADRPEDAIGEFRASAKKHRGDAMRSLCYWGEGKALRRMGRPGEAVAALRKAARLAPDDPFIPSELGAALVEAGSYAEAEEMERARKEAEDR